MGRNDARLVGRDQMMIGLVMYPLVMVLVLAFGFRPLTSWLLSTASFDLGPYWSIAVAYGLVTAMPMFFGIVFGMLLIEEEEDGTLIAMMVTPLSLDRFVGYRAFAAAALSFMLMVVTLPLIGIITLPPVSILPIAFLAALSAPMNALFFFSLAANRVQAFGMLKVISTVNVLPLIAFFVPVPWQYILGLFPPYWVAKATWEAAAGNPYWFYFIPGLILYGIYLYVLVNRFQTKAYSGVV